MKVAIHATEIINLTHLRLAQNACDWYSYREFSNDNKKGLVDLFASPAEPDLTWRAGRTNCIEEERLVVDTR